MMVVTRSILCSSISAFWLCLYATEVEALLTAPLPPTPLPTPEEAPEVEAEVFTVLRPVTAGEGDGAGDGACAEELILRAAMVLNL